MGTRVAVIVAMLIAIGTDLGLSIVDSASGEGQWHRARDAMDGDCANAGPNPDGSVQFIYLCPTSASSPDGDWILRITRAAGANEWYEVLITDRQGRTIGPVPGLNDHMPFVLLWSPRSRWFLINHWVGSFMEVPRVFEITDAGVIEHDSFMIAGQKMAIRLNPCLGDGSFEANWGRSPSRRWASGTGHRWSRDGRRLVWSFTTRIDACMEKNETGPIQPDDQWHPFYMISDVENGTVDPASIRMIDKDGLRIPNDGAYANF